MTSRLRAVTFDVWQTLLHDTPESKPGGRSDLRIQAMLRVLHEAGAAVEEAALRDAYQRLGAYCAAVWLAREFDHEAQLRWLLAEARPPEPVRLSEAAWRALEVAYVDAIHQAPPRLAPHAPQAIREIKARGLRVGLICNTGYTPGYALRRLFQEWGILEEFDDLAFSNEEGLRKPETELYHRVATRLGVDPAGIAHIGDDLDTDIAGAKRAGYRAILVRPQRPASLPVEPDAFVPHLGELASVLDQWI